MNVRAPLVFCKKRPVLIVSGQNVKSLSSFYSSLFFLKINFQLWNMGSKKWNNWLNTLNKAVSLLVLVGFLSIQFHSFTHIDFHLHSDSLKDQQEQTSPEFKNSSFNHGKKVECPECLLTKHLQIDLPVTGLFEIIDSSQFFGFRFDERNFESNNPYFHLRAPPVHAV